MKQTAVEWFAKELKKRYKRNNAHLTISEWAANMIDKLAEQAIEMEKQQRMDAHGKLQMFSEQYYEENYGSKKCAKCGASEY